MKQNQKGITMVGLIVTVFVIVIIAGVCIYTGRDLLEEAKFEQIKTNMLLIQAKCQQVGERVVAKELTEADYIGTGITLSDSDYEKYQKTKTENDKWYSLSADNVKNDIGLGKIKVNDGDYLVNYADNEVIYTTGYNNMYKLSDLLK